MHKMLKIINIKYIRIGVKSPDFAAFTPSCVCVLLSVTIFFSDFSTELLSELLSLEPEVMVLFSDFLSELSSELSPLESDTSVLFSFFLSELSSELSSLESDNVGVYFTDNSNLSPGLRDSIDFWDN